MALQSLVVATAYLSEEESDSMPGLSSESPNLSRVLAHMAMRTLRMDELVHTMLNHPPKLEHRTALEIGLVYQPIFLDCGLLGEKVRGTPSVLDHNAKHRRGILAPPAFAFLFGLVYMHSLLDHWGFHQYIVMTEDLGLPADYPTHFGFKKEEGGWSMSGFWLFAEGHVHESTCAVYMQKPSLSR